MSARAEHWVLQICEEHEDLRPVHCHVLQLLAIRHDHDYGMAWPSVERMAAESHYTERAIFRALDELTSLGLLHRSHGELPRKSRRDRVKLGNRYAFPGLDEITEDEQPRLLGGRPQSRLDEPDSSIPEAVEMNLTQALDERDVTAQSRLDEPDAYVTPESTEGRSPSYVRNGQTQARAPEAPPRRAADDDDDEPATTEQPPPRWEELAPGIHRGAPGGLGEVVLLKARCPRCERSLPVEEIEGHECELVQGKPIHSGPVTPGNLGSYFRRRRQREPIPAEVRMELAAMAAQSRAGPADIPADLRAEHERRLAQAQDRPS